MNFKKLRKFILFYLCLTILLWRCGLDSGESEPAQDIIYKVGSFKASRYEVDHDFANFRKSYTRISDRLIESWMDEMRTKAYFLADAYAKRYDTLSVIQKKLDFAFKYKIAEEGGYLWKRNVAPKLEVSDSEVEDAYRKREDLYYMELVFFSDDRLLREISKRFSTGAPPFRELVKELRGRPGVEFASSPLIYPFAQLASVKEEIYQMKVGDVLGPVSEPEGSYIIQLTSKQKRNLLPIEEDQQFIEQDLVSLKRKLAIDSKQDSIYRTSKAVFDDHNIERLAQRLKNKTATSAEMDTAVLMTYHLGNSKHHFLAKHYHEFIRYMPILVGDFAEPQQIRNNLKDHLIRTYLYEEAGQMGILVDKTFLLERQHYFNALLEQHYYTKEFEQKVGISEQELIDYYKENQSSFPAEQIAWVSFMEFANEEVAYDGISYFQSVLARGDTPKRSDAKDVQGLLDIKEPELINGANTTWGEENRKQFMDAKVNILSGPIRHNDRVYLYYVSKKGVENVKDFSTVRKKIYSRLKHARIEELKIKKSSDLKTQFKEDAEGLKAYCEARKSEL
jgi:hypothetical protein